MRRRKGEWTAAAGARDMPALGMEFAATFAKFLTFIF